MKNLNQFLYHTTIMKHKHDKWLWPWLMCPQLPCMYSQIPIMNKILIMDEWSQKQTKHSHNFNNLLGATSYSLTLDLLLGLWHSLISSKKDLSSQDAIFKTQNLCQTIPVHSKLLDPCWNICNLPIVPQMWHFSPFLPFSDTYCRLICSLFSLLGTG
jgi:hypothetical protein